MDGKTLCSPIDGGIEIDINGKLQCGPGYCIRDLKGKVFCSTTPKGAASVDINGKPVCTGSCTPGQNRLCLTPSF
ncbi:MAG: hypothetical protein LBU72_08300 [Burkholderiaceae bacterium]|jgi:hypothetical protein|nr:hypothetical protein [Burkholderiaceae bacterium]